MRVTSVFHAKKASIKNPTAKNATAKYRYVCGEVCPGLALKAPVVPALALYAHARAGALRFQEQVTYALPLGRAVLLPLRLARRVSILTLGSLDAALIVELRCRAPKTHIDRGSSIDSDSGPFMLIQPLNDD